MVDIIGLAVEIGVVAAVLGEIAVGTEFAATGT
jgi:hypothetical protein